MTLKIHSLSVRYLLTFGLLVLVPVVLFALLINGGYSRYQGRVVKRQMQETVNQMALNVNNEIAAVSILSSALNHNAAFLEICDRYHRAEDYAEVYNLYEQLDREISNLFLYTNKVGVIYVFVRNKPVFEFGNFPLKSNLPGMSRSNPFFRDDVESQPGFIHIADDFFALFPAKTDPEEPLLLLGVRPDSSRPGSSVDKILFAYRINLFNQIYGNPSRDQFFFLTDPAGRVLLESRFNDLGQEVLRSHRAGLLDEARWLLLSSVIESTGWILYHGVDQREMMAPFRRIRRFSYTTLAGLFALFIAYTMVFFQSMISPLNILIEKMGLIEEGDYAVRVPEPAQAEMHHLIHSFNRMIEEVQTLTARQSRADRERGELELQALQSQINPHFIANTLNSIRLMAVVKKNDNIKKMTNSLMQVINDSFRGQGNRTTLKEEMVSLSSYVHIMKVRLSSPMELRFSIPEGLKEYPILKMLLQPLVENAIVHGFAEKKGKGIILVQALPGREGAVRLRVSDNGCGMAWPAEEPSSAPEVPRAGTLTRVGINNVDRRITLNYGEEYGLTVKSRRGNYTSVELLLPRMEEVARDFGHDRG